MIKSKTFYLFLKKRPRLVGVLFKIVSILGLKCESVSPKIFLHSKFINTSNIPYNFKIDARVTDS